MADRDAISELFARARDSDIAEVAGVTLFRAGRRLRGECPSCGASKGKRAGGAFSVEPDAKLFYCFGCLEGGDVVDLERLLRGGSSREAAERLVGPVAERSRARPAVEPRRVDPKPAMSTGERLARQIWGEAQTSPIAATPAGGYLAARGIWGAVLGSVGDRLRFHPRAPWAWDGERGDWIRAPAIVGRPETPAGPTGGVHVTYLTADFTRKARLDPAKRMWGPQKDTEGRPGGLWLTARDAPGPLLVGEGIESTLSAAMLLNRPCRVVATLSLGALQGGWLADKWGRIDVSAVAGDPERPAFTWPGVGEAIVAVDRDMGGVKVKVRKLSGGTVEHRLESDERARICAGLAVQAWRRAGTNAVRAIAPAAGRDFNDELMGRYL